MKAPIFETYRLILEPLSQKHVSERYLSWLNDPEVYRYLESGGNYTMSQLIDYVVDAEKKDIYFWAISLKENKKHIGNIKIDPIQTRHQTGEYAIMMGDQAEWAKGYAQEASLKIIDFAFSTLQLRKITLGVVQNNTSAVKLYEKLGFMTEGIYKQHGFYDGKYCDVLRMALFNPNLKQSS